MAELSGQFFDPGSGLTLPVVLEWDALADTLRLRGEGLDHEVPGSSITVATGGWQGQAVFLTWAEGDRGYAVGVTDRETLRSLATLLSASLARELEKAISASLRSSRRARWTFALVALLLLAPLALLLALYAFRGRIVDAALLRIPTSVDARLGDLALEQVSRSGSLVQEGSVVEAVRTIGERLTTGGPEGPHRFRFFVARAPSPNAYAAPGGVIVVHAGLVAAAASPDELAGVLAHEMTHVLERHSMRQLIYQSGLATALRLLIGSPEGGAAVLSGAALDLTTLRFSRAQELAADRGAVQLLRRAGLPASGLAALFERLDRAGGAPPAWLSSHPDGRTRAAQVHELTPHPAETSTSREESLLGRWQTVRDEAAALAR